MAGDLQSQLQAVKPQMQNPTQQPQVKDRRQQGGGNRGGTESAMFHPPVPGRGGNDKEGPVDAEELARQERNRRNEETRRTGRDTERPRDDRRERGPRDEGGRGNFRGRQDGGFVPESVQPRRESRPAVGQEAAIKRPENVPENRTAKLILELGKVSVALKALCSGLLKYTKHEDTESTQIGEEKTRLTLELTSYIEASDELRGMLVNKERPTIGDLEISKAQTTIHMLELLREVDNLDGEAISLPEKDTIEWRRLEKAKNELRLFVGDTESITQIPTSLPRPETTAARIPNAETEQIKHANPPIAKLFNALHKQEEDLPALVSWHKEYILNGGIDTYRNKNTDTQISEEKVNLLKEILYAILESLNKLSQSETSVRELVTSRKSGYLSFAEMLSGNPKPNSPTEFLYKNMTEDSLKKDLQRISGEDTSVERDLHTNGLEAQGNIKDVSATPSELSPEKYSEIATEMLNEFIAGKKIDKALLLNKGFTEKQADEFLVAIGS